ncbi:nuclear transport factor 2 family protein [Streptomyces sp. AC602_WCS936]|uniref:nuclear transport factor 2 family protein n=1 Tax=Streptomyces sp. AC602_WCS936 TaxID=2823685 RepID=UPI0027E51273|nr:nuclear transport factor 2 family protein [Streptomyces sp. AC602_WCS936]
MTLPHTGYTPTAEDRASLDAWFEEYDALCTKCDVERMADQAVFPLNLISDDSAGNGRSAQWDRRQFVDTMSHVMGDGSQEVTFRNTRTPVFLSRSMAVVFTHSVVTAGDQTYETDYADVLVRKDGAWAFQTMIQGGWGDNL